MIVTLLTDFGRGDDFAGVCHAVILGICPSARVIDLTHGIPRHDVRRGALSLRNALPYVPAGVHMAVVDPGVGTARRGVALRCGHGRLLVGPDNGLLSLAWERLGGVEDAVDLARSPVRLEPVSPTFHGRDVFAPVAAHLAAGVALDRVGERVDPSALARIELPTARFEGGVLVAHVLTIDSFGNVELDASRDQLPPGRRVRLDTPAGRFELARAETFAEVEPGGALLYEDSYGAVAVALNQGHAGESMGLEPDAEVRISARTPG